MAGLFPNGYVLKIADNGVAGIGKLREKLIFITLQNKVLTFSDEIAVRVECYREIHTDITLTFFYLHYLLFIQVDG